MGRGAGRNKRIYGGGAYNNIIYLYLTNSSGMW
jgi:hypothetical protein